MEMMAMSTMSGDRDEDFNTRFGSYRGWQMAIERVKPIPRTVPAGPHGMVLERRLQHAGRRGRLSGTRFLSVPLDAATRHKLAGLPRNRTRDARPEAAVHLCRRFAAPAAAPDAEPSGIPARLSRTQRKPRLQEPAP
jgi:hypothetical protein